MITIENYFDKVKEINFAFLPMKLKKGYAYVKEATENYQTWDFYYTYDIIKKTVNDFLEALNRHINSTFDKPNQRVLPDNEPEAKEIAKTLIWNYVQRGKTIEQLKAIGLSQNHKRFSAAIRGNRIHVYRIEDLLTNFSFPIQSIYNDALSDIMPDAKAIANISKTELVKNPDKTNFVERINEEIKFIKRYTIMNGKEKTDLQILNFINSLQKSILEKRIRKHSIYKNEIIYIQAALVKLYNRLLMISNPKKRIETIRIEKKIFENFSAIAGSEKNRLSVNYLKRYIGIQGKMLTKEKVSRLLDLIKKAVEKRKIFGNDPYAERLEIVYNSLEKFVKIGKKTDTLEVHPGVLNGINEALNGIDVDELGCDCEKKKAFGIAGIEPAKDISSGNVIMNSMDFAKMEFETLGFTGKYLTLIGDPCAGFTAMIFSMPKMGKSFFAIDFAGYLARNHGNVLYVAKEEALHQTLQIKLNKLKAQHPALSLSNYLPKDLTPYQFVFLDSVDILELHVQDLLDLKKLNPEVSFISIHQVTKLGAHRGSMQHKHNVDIIIEIPERGKVIQYGRFNQGSEMNIFENLEDEQEV